MSSIIEASLFNIIIFLITVVVCATGYVKYSYGYWKRRKVPYLEPKFPFGNSYSGFPKGIAIGAVTQQFYKEFKRRGHVVGGIYFGIDPNLVIMSPELIRDILVKDFQSFIDRGVYQTESDPISVNLFSQPGTEWRNARLKFTSVFTSVKLKTMFQTMVDCSQGLKGALEKFCEQKSDINMFDVTGCFTTDVIGSCAFGISCNSFKDPDAEFRMMGRKLFTEFSFIDRVNLFFTIYTPKLAQKLGLRNVQKDVSRFFTQSVLESVHYRETNQVRRNDLLQLLIDLKNSDVHLSMDEIVAQTFLFFVAGFETSSTTTTLSLYELSRNEEVQERVRNEILEILGKHDNKISYDAIAEMKYLAQVVDETLRIWPPVATITRVCTKDYKLKNTDVVVEKGTFILIPALGLHKDPEYWPDPERWDPDRFSDENKDNNVPFTYLPFGEGPRHCIGLRFGRLQTKLALVTILSKYRVSLSPKTITPLGADQDTFVLRTLNPVYLRLEKI